MKDEDIAQADEDAAPDARTDPEAGAGEGTAGPETPERRIAALEAENAELRDQYLRKAADFDNYRKRMIKERAESADFANQSLILDLLPVIDDLERAIKAAETAVPGGAAEAGESNALYEGVSMIEKRLLSQLENRWGLKRFDSAGEPFDPNRHEAIMMEKSADTAEPVVTEDFVKGYVLKDRVIRAAKVKVVMPAGDAGAAEGAAAR